MSEKNQHFERGNRWMSFGALRNAWITPFFYQFQKPFVFLLRPHLIFHASQAMFGCAMLRVVGKWYAHPFGPVGHLNVLGIDYSFFRLGILITHASHILLRQSLHQSDHDCQKGPIVSETVRDLPMPVDGRVVHSTPMELKLKNALAYRLRTVELVSQC